nr:MAG TPA: hypothetical protein [Caudoviricetes sp.]
MRHLEILRCVVCYVILMGEIMVAERWLTWLLGSKLGSEVVRSWM